MKAGLFLLALSLLAALAVLRILEIPLGFSRLRPSGGRRARLPSAKAHTRGGESSRSEDPVTEDVAQKRGGHPFPRLLKKGRSIAAPRLARPRAPVRRIQPTGPPIIESPVPLNKPASTAEASSKLLLLIIVYGAGMAVFSVLLLRWLAALLQQASS